MSKHVDGGGGLLGKILTIVLLIAGLAIFAWLASKAIGSLTADAAVKGKQYQAVFLTNGQVYFGKVSHVDSSYVKIQDIYYLQVQQTVQPSQGRPGSGSTYQAATRVKASVALVPPKPKEFDSTQFNSRSSRLRRMGKSSNAGSSSSMCALSQAKPLFSISSE